MPALSPVPALAATHPVDAAPEAAAGRPVRRFEPTRLTRDAARLACRLAVRRQPSTLSLGTTAATLSGPVWLAADPGPRPETIALDLQIDRRPARLRLPAVLVRWIAGQADPALIHADLDGEAIGWLAEWLFADLLTALERDTGLTLSVAAGMGPAPSPSATVDTALGFSVRGKALPPATAILLTDVDIADRLAAAAETRPRAPAAFADLPLPVSVRIGVTRLPLGELRSLQTGDVILADDALPDRRCAMLVVGEQRVAVVELGDGRARLADKPDMAIGTMGAWIMDQPHATPAGSATGTAPAGPDDADAALDDLPVQLVFEVGRTEMALGALRTMAPGHAFDLKLDPADAVDILANGKRIGRGRVVQIGDSLGVQVVRLFGHD